jgi:hypothetical protein
LKRRNWRCPIRERRSVPDHRRACLRFRDSEKREDEATSDEEPPQVEAHICLPPRLAEEEGTGFSKTLDSQIRLLPTGDAPIRTSPTDYDVAADGRFIAVRRENFSGDTIHVVLNWTTELAQALGR